MIFLEKSNFSVPQIKKKKKYIDLSRTVSQLSSIVYKALNRGNKGKGSEHSVNQFIWELIPKQKLWLFLCWECSVDGLNCC